MCIGFICSQALPTPNTHNTLRLFKTVFQYTLKSHTHVSPSHQINSSPSGTVFWYWHSINLNIRSGPSCMASSPLSHADTFATAIIKVHSPHSFLSFFFGQSKHCSRGTSAFPFSYPQADTKVPSETEHKHSKVAVTQGRLVWELREPCALPPRLGEAHVQRSKRGPQILKTQLHLGMSGPHGQGLLDGPGMLTCELKWRLFMAGGGSEFPSWSIHDL